MNIYDMAVAVILVRHRTSLKSLPMERRILELSVILRLLGDKVETMGMESQVSLDALVIPM